MAGIRKDIAKLGGPWSDTMLWYARAVGELRTRQLRDRTSWLYLAAIHGINPQGWIDQNIISPTTPAPNADEQRLMFNQCQHAGGFSCPGTGAICMRSRQSWQTGLPARAVRRHGLCPTGIISTGLIRRRETIAGIPGQHHSG